MPNDMSPCSALSDPNDALLTRAARYVRRAREMVADPALRQGEAATALDHLARMQKDLTAARLTRVRPLEHVAKQAGQAVATQEAALEAVREELSEALIQARAEPNADCMMGLIPHGPAQRGEVATQPASVCRAMLDLEALRPYLSEDAIREAAARHGRETGQCDLTGVTYAALPASAQLKCDVL